MGVHRPGRGRSLHLWWVMILSLTLVAVVHCQSDFLNIDCGKAQGFSYNDSMTGLFYTSDHQYVSTGETHRVSTTYMTTSGYYTQSYDLRSFPNGTRNCYTLPVKPHRKYLAKASFLYGNYDGQNQLPQFALHAGVNHWFSVTIKNESVNLIQELLFVTGAKTSMDFCLLKTGGGAPFISALELRPLPDDLYPQVNASLSLVLMDRADDGATADLRYPNDAYDRMWFPYSLNDWTTLKTSDPVETVPGYQPPLDVLQTAASPATGSTLKLPYGFTVDTAVAEPRGHVFLYFAELQQLKPNESRAFNIILNDKPWNTFNPVRPAYLKALTIYTTEPVIIYPLKVLLQQTSDSTLPPIVNGAEVYMVGDMTGEETAQQDVDTINSIKVFYKVQRNWQGDPCSPSSFTWEGLKCSSDPFRSLRIISLDLASSGLTGEISAALGNLTQLQSLDLSRNNLTGEIPISLANLTQIKYLDLTGNRLNGPVPQPLLDRAAAGALTLKYGLGSNSCNGSTTCETKKKSKSKLIAVLGASIGFTVVFVGVLVAVIFWRKKMKEPGRPGNQRNETKARVPGKHLSNSFPGPKLSTRNKQFTYADLVRITNNFEKEIGRGGFGSVYHGVLDNDVKVEVAVKLLSKSSSQGPKEFQNEAILLTRIHHRHLLSLIGYCKDDMNSLALVYEYMVEGSLHDHLQGWASKMKGPLNWMRRLHIAVESAQGLEYLHHGCKPPIIHRDVKTKNILLDQNFEAKIADFGLSRIFENEAHSHISTKIVGTPGYLDPEYSTTNKLTEKSDVYSFGIVLLELITGHPPNLITSNGTSLVHWVQERFQQGNIREIVDKNLQGNYNINSAWKVLEIALTCTNFISMERPSMDEVRSLLKDCLELEASKMGSHTSNYIEANRNSNASKEISPIDITTISGR